MILIDYFINMEADNGVGKSLTAKTIAEALFQYGNPSTGDFRGILYLRGEQYQVLYSILSPLIHCLIVLKGVDRIDEHRKVISKRIFFHYLFICDE